MPGICCLRYIQRNHKICISFHKRILEKFEVQHVSNAQNISTSSRIYANQIHSNLTPDDDVKPRSRIHELIQEFYRDSATGGIVPVFKKALLYGDRVAIEDDLGEHSYAKLYGASKTLSIKLSSLCGSGSESRVAFLCENNFNYIVAQWGCWISGQIAVPLSDKSPKSLMEYYVKDSEVDVLVGTPKYESILTSISMSLNKQVVIIEPSYHTECKNKGSLTKEAENVLKFGDSIIVEGCQFGNFYARANAMILYTSGSTGPPKGVVLTHKNLHSQIKCLTSAWKWSPTDCILHTLPLNHTHGIVNALLCPLDVGAKVIMSSKFDASEVLQYLSGGKESKPNIFMGVPTMYTKLIDEYERSYANHGSTAKTLKEYLMKNIRLMVSGSAPLTGNVFEKWYNITGHKLLERYGMTEIGMALSNPYIESETYKRTIGSVGYPLPGVEIKLVKFEGDEFNVLAHVKGKSGEGPWKDCFSEDFLHLFNREDNESANAAFLKNSTSSTPIERPSIEDLLSEEDENKINENNVETPFTPLIPKDKVEGEIIIQGPNVFKQYYNKIEESYDEFVDIDWFKTGDTACFDKGIFRIQGRTSVDIIKTGGYKVSALDIENCLIQHPDILDCTVVGLPDEKWGEKITSMIVFAEGKTLDVLALKKWAETRIAEYSIPKQIIEVKEIPRNAMGKVNKKEIIKNITK